ncbi:hypothetical protein DESC_700086 [Desulfosarcina cetonica]|nr:hypothetical protein DESC_700086 [Desulfosarcina cetonica]
MMSRHFTHRSMLNRLIQIGAVANHKDIYRSWIFLNLQLRGLFEFGMSRQAKQCFHPTSCVHYLVYMEKRTNVQNEIYYGKPQVSILLSRRIGC